MFKLSFETDNAAFAAWPDCGRTETARILREIAGKVEAGEDRGKCMDANGNTVGEWKLTD